MTTHIQIPDTAPRVQYTGNGAQTVFTYPFPIFQASDILVTVNNTPQVNNYAVQGAGQTIGGSVIFDAAPLNGSVIALERRMPIRRVSDFLEGGELAANSLNNEFDYLTACMQQIQDDTKYMLRFEKSDSVGNTVPEKINRVNKVLGFDGNGEMTVFETTGTYTAPTVTQSGTGAVSRTLTNKVKDLVSVKDFGAVGDGVADDTIPLQSALNAHNNVYMPPGTYRVTTSLEISNNTTLHGAGKNAVIKANSNAFDTVAIIGSNCDIRDLCIDGGNIALRLYGKALPCNQNLVSNLLIKNAANGIELDGYSNVNNTCNHNRIDNITIEKPTVKGVSLTRSGAGAHPDNNFFVNIRVYSNGTSISTAGFYAEAAKYNNSFIDCVADLAGTPTACFRIGASSEKTTIINLTTRNGNAVPNVKIDSGAVDTSIINLYAASSGAAIQDSSGGSYTAFNAGATEKNMFKRTRINDLTVEQQRYSFQNVALPSTGTQSIDLSKTMHFVNAANGKTTMELPQAAAGNSGAVVTIKKTDSSGNVVAVTEISGSGPDSKNDFALGSQNDCVTVMSDGTTWRIMYSNIMPPNFKSVTGISIYHPDVTRLVHLVSAAAGLTTVELPAPASNPLALGRVLVIKRMDNTGNTLRVTTEGATGPDGSIQTLASQYKSITVMCDGTAWHVLNRYV